MAIMEIISGIGEIIIIVIKIGYFSGTNNDSLPLLHRLEYNICERTLSRGTPALHNV